MLPNTEMRPPLRKVTAKVSSLLVVSCKPPCFGLRHPGDRPYTKCARGSKCLPDEDYTRIARLLHNTGSAKDSQPSVQVCNAMAF